MPRGGRREGAGRKPGRRSATTIQTMQTLGELAKSLTEEAIGTLAAIMRDEGASGPARVSAANSLLERGWGKPITHVEVGAPGAFDDMNLEQKRDKAIALARQLGLDRIGPTAGTA